MTNVDHVSTETLADYAEGLLRESESAAVAAHLAGCADCRAEELLLASLSELLASDNPGPMPAVYAERIDAALAAVSAEVAMTDPHPGSFHPAGPQPAALDLTPSVLAAAAAEGAKSAEVIDLAARRKVVAQGLSRVTTVAASIVLLIGGTVLGLQALNSGDDRLDSPNEFAQKADEGVAPTARATIQPSPIRNSAVPIYVGAKKNPDGSYTNPNGVVVRPDGSAVLLNGKVLKPEKAGKKQGSPAEPVDPSMPTGPIPEREATDSAQSKTGQGPVTAFRDDDKSAPATVDGALPQDPAANPEPTAAEGDASAAPAPDEQATAEAGTPEPATDGSAPAKAAGAPEGADGPGTSQAETAQAPQQKKTTRGVYVEESGSEYTSDNFAEKVLRLLDRAGYRESSVGTAQVEGTDQGTDPAPASTPAAGDYQATSFTTAMRTPAAADAADATEVSDSAAQGTASPEVKRRVLRCARQLNGTAVAGDTGTWKGAPVTIVVVPDPEDDRQVIARAISGNCTADSPASDPDNVQHVQFVVVKP